MADHKQVGDFQVFVSSPSPVCIEIRHRGGNFFMFDADDLGDLEYAVRWAIRAAAGKTVTTKGDDHG